MTYEALIAVAPITTLARINDPAWQGTDRQMYDAAGLTLIPGQTATVLVNHDDDDVLGTIDRLQRIEDTNGPWLAAVATLNRCPDWLDTRYTRASMGIKAAQVSHTFECQITRRAFLTEVSLLTADRQPKEPSARLLTLKRTEAKPAIVGTEIPPVIRRAAPIPEDHERTELLRRLDWHEQHGTGATFEMIIEAMQRELPRRNGGLLRLAG